MPSILIQPLLKTPPSLIQKISVLAWGSIWARGWLDETLDRLLEGLARGRQQIARAARRPLSCRSEIVGGHDEGKIADVRVVEGAAVGIAEADQHAVDLDDVVGGLDVQTRQEIIRRRVIEAYAPVGRQFRRQPRKPFKPALTNNAGAG